MGDYWPGALAPPTEEAGLLSKTLTPNEGSFHPLTPSPWRKRLWQTAREPTEVGKGARPPQSTNREAAVQDTGQSDSAYSCRQAGTRTAAHNVGAHLYTRELQALNARTSLHVRMSAPRAGRKSKCVHHTQMPIGGWATRLPTPATGHAPHLAFQCWLKRCSQAAEAWDLERWEVQLSLRPCAGWGLWWRDSPGGAGGAPGSWAGS